MRLWRGTHARLAAGLRAVQAGDAQFSKQTAPGGIGDDHQFRDQFVERAAALAGDDVDPTGFGIGEVAVDFKVVIVHALRGGRLAAPRFAGVGEMPEGEEFVAERVVRQSAVHARLVEPGFDFVMAQVGDDGRQFGAGFAACDVEFAVHRQIERKAGAIAPAFQRIGAHHGFGQHGDFRARHINGGQTGAGDGVERAAVGNRQAGGGDVNADAPAAVSAWRDRQRIVDFRGVGVVDGKGAHAVGARQFVGDWGRSEVGKVRALRELLGEKAAQMHFVGRFQRPDV